MLRRIFLLEWLYPSALKEQDRVNRMFIVVVILLCTAILILGSWMWYWDTETQARREAANTRIEQWKEQVRQYEARKAEQDSIVGEWKERNK